MIATACGEKFQDISSVILTDSILTETIPTESLSTSTTLIAETTVPQSTTVTIMTTGSAISQATTMYDEKNAEIQLVKEILMFNDSYCKEEYAEEDAELMVHAAEPFSKDLLGSINSVEDAEEKGRAILIRWTGQEFIDDLESDYFVSDGKQIKLERDNPPYFVNYYENYDVWIVKAILRSGKLEGGGYIATPGESPYVLLRGSDGKVLAVY